MLDGKTIAITRSSDDAAEFIALAEQNNATPIPLPTIELVSKGEKIVDKTEFNPVTGEARASLLICATQNTSARHITVKTAPQNHDE